MGGQAVDSTLGEVFTAEFAGLGVSAGRIISQYTNPIKLYGARVTGPKWQASLRPWRVDGRGFLEETGSVLTCWNCLPAWDPAGSTAGSPG